jgi:hypothetical protein
MRLEACGRPILRDASLRDAPQDEAEQGRSKDLGYQNAVPGFTMISTRGRGYDIRSGY